MFMSESSAAQPAAIQRRAKRMGRGLRAFVMDRSVAFSGMDGNGVCLGGAGRRWFGIERGKGNGYASPTMKIVKDGYSLIAGIPAACATGRDKDGPKEGEP